VTPHQQATRRQRTNRFVLFGPHKRWNFGDLLFEKVLSKLLIDRIGYDPRDILHGGVVSINMSDFGGQE
jgi:hypothetical protein